MKALVVGGGIGGLSASIALVRAGFAVELVERAGVIAEVGAGLQLSPNAMKGLEALGVAERVATFASAPQALQLRLGQSGRVVFSIPLAEDAMRRYGAPYLHVHRADLVEALLGAAHEAGVNVRLGAGAAGVTHEAGRVRLGLETGDILEADVLVGADGIHSLVRETLFGVDSPRFTGAVAWRCTVPADAAPDLPQAAIVWAGNKRHAVTYRVRRGELINFVGVVETDGWRKEGWSERGEVADMRRDFEGWDASVTQVLDAAKACWRWALFDRDPMPAWVNRRAVLLGDACHAMPPFQAQGAAMAIEDAVVLGRCLSDGAGIEPGLARYQALRKPRVDKVLASARSNMGVFHRSNPLTQLATYGPMALADRLLPSFVRSRQDWIYSYDPAKA